MDTHSHQPILDQQEKFKIKTIRCIKIGALALAAGAGLPHLATAQPPEPTYKVPASDSCVTFGLDIYIRGARNVQNEFFDKNNRPVRIISAGKGSENTFVNQVSGASLVIRANGSVTKTTFNDDGSITYVNTGHNGLIMFAADDPGPSAIEYIGKLIYTVDANGITHIEGTSGKQVDICAALSG